MIPKLSGMEIIAEVIRANYELGEVGMPQQLEAVHQRRHRKMFVDTDKGRFLIKTYHNDPVVIDALHFQHRLSWHLQSNNLPVAPIQYTREGKGLVVVDDWVLELQSFVEGETMMVNTSSLIASASALGKFHHVCQALPVPPRDTRKWRFSEVPFNAFQQMYDSAIDIRKDIKLQKHCDDLALFLQNASIELSEKKRDKLEIGLIHGDWHGGNLLFNCNKLVAILDLEFAGDGCYLEDIAYAISNLCIRTTADTEKMLLRTNLLIDHYQYSRSLSIFESMALYYAIGVKHIATVAYQLQQQKGLVAGLDAASWLERLTIQCKWLEQQARKVRFGY